MRIVHIYNNNVVLAQSDSGEQAVVLGRGLAFGAKKGQEIDPAKIEQTFTPQSADDDHVSALLSEIPSDVLQVATELEIYAKE
ncbi:CAT RNA binding domain-containing protein [Rothia terrae]